MVTINKSFWYGICCASFTWMISLYLYWQLNKTEINNVLPTGVSNKHRAEKIVRDWHYNALESNDNKINHKWQNVEEHKQNLKNYFNSEKLLEQLQPRFPKIKGATSDEQSTIYEHYILIIENKMYFLVLNELGMVKSLDDQNTRDEGYKQHAFNVLVSNKLSYHRNIPDTRNEL